MRKLSLLLLLASLGCAHSRIETGLGRDVDELKDKYAYILVSPNCPAKPPAKNCGLIVTEKFQKEGLHKTCENEPDSKKCIQVHSLIVLKIKETYSYGNATKALEICEKALKCDFSTFEGLQKFEYVLMREHNNNAVAEYKSELDHLANIHGVNDTHCTTTDNGLGTLYTTCN